MEHLMIDEKKGIKQDLFDTIVLGLDTIDKGAN